VVHFDAWWWMKFPKVEAKLVGFTGTQPPQQKGGKPEPPAHPLLPPLPPLPTPMTNS